MCGEHFRRVKRRPEAPLELDGRLDPSVGPQGHARSDAASTLKAALQQIPPDQAEVIALHWLDGLSFPEVAEVVGATLSAVKVRAHRGYAAMRAYLDRDVGNPGSKSGIEP